MNKSPLKKKIKKQNINYSNRKKHVETMFLTNKTKHHPFYYKNKRLFRTFEKNTNNLTPPFTSISVRVFESGYLTLKPLKSIARFFKWFSKSHLFDEKTKLRWRVFPDFVLTSKPKEVRMGKGKGANFEKVAPIKAGQILCSVGIVNLQNRELVKLLIQKLSFKIPFKHKVILNTW